MLKRLLLALGLLSCVCGFPFSLLGLAQAYWISALPNQSPEHVWFNWTFWVSATVLTLALMPVLAYLLRAAVRDDKTRGGP